MKLLVRHTVLILFMWLLLAGVCLGKQVYLIDGSIIESQSAWRHGNKVFVKVNRDIVADFNLNEIDLRRTFPKSGSSSRHLSRKATPGAAIGAAGSKSPAAAEPTPPVVKPGPKAEVQLKPVVATPAPKPVEPPAKVSPQQTAGATAPAMPQQETPVQKKSGFPVLLLLTFLAVGILIIAGQWIIFQKAGQAGWKSLVPFYNMYILMEISGKPGWWMFLLFIPLVGFAIYLFAMLSLAKRFGRSELFGVGLMLLPMVFFPLLAFGGSEYEG